MHGGASPKGEAHPRYKHGKYSKYKPVDIDALLAQIRDLPPPDLSWLEDLPNPLEGLDLNVDISELLDTPW